MLTIERLKGLLNYDEDSGNLTWLVDKKSAKTGDIVGFKSKQPYYEVHIDGQKYLVHRLVWFYSYGVWPNIIDHRDGNTRNNSLKNLREVTVAQNSLNKKRSKNNLCGAKNVSYKQDRNKYAVNLDVDGKPKHIGHYPTIELAKIAATEARIKYHGEYAKHD